VVTGSFEGTVDFNPTETITTLTSAGGTDVFVARYHPVTGEHEWAFKVGDDDDDVGLGVAVDQYNSARLVHCGHFRGEPDFDPGAGTATASTTGIEGFANVLRHAPGESDLHITLLLDANELQPGFGSLEGKDLGLGLADYRRLGIADAIESEVPLGGVHKAVSMQLVMYGASHYGHDEDEPLLRKGAMQLIPPTALTAQTRDLFASRLNAIASHHRFGTEQPGNPGDGLRLATDFMEDARYDDLGGVTRHALFVTGGFLGFSNYPLNDARNEAVDASGGPPAFHLLHGLANFGGGGSIDRLDMLGSVSLATGALEFPNDPVFTQYKWSKNTAAFEEDLHCGMAAEVPGYSRASGNEYVMEEHYLDLVSIMLARCSHLLGDYDRDGAVEITFGGGSCFACTSGAIGLEPCSDDWDAFLADVDSDPYANSDLDAVYTFNQQTGLWERAEQWNGDVGPPTPANSFGVDFSKFMVWMMFSKGHTCQ
jgi:hypothetical protein